MIVLITALLSLPLILYISSTLINHNVRSKFKRVDNKAKHDTLETVGILTAFLNMLKQFFADIRFMAFCEFELYQKHGKDDGIFVSYLSFIENVVVINPEAIKTIMLHSITYPKYPLLLSSAFGDYASSFFGSNLAVIDGVEWRKQRHVINPAFYNLAKFYPAFEEHVDKFIKNVEHQKGPVNVPKNLANMTVDILGKTVLGQDFGAQDDKLNAIIDSYYFMMGNAFRPLYTVLPFLTKLPTKFNKDFNQHLNSFDDFIYDLIQKAHDKYKNGVDEQETLLDLMVKTQHEDSESKLDDKVLRDNTVLFFVAGHETTAVTLAFQLYRLGLHSEVQQKLYEEIIDVVNGDIENLSLDLLQEMDYMDAFIKESMRLHPPAQLPGRITAQDVTLCGYRIPKGTMVTPSIYGVHHSDVYYGQDVKQFRPERWLGEEAKKIHRFAHIPFSAGPRVCLGNNFSLIEQKLFLSKFLHKFIVKLQPDQINLERALDVNKDFAINVSTRQ
ncbi:cytochrome P450 [Acrasis kona]|uniref:Cytochrome P450 n=1 Tax=Acrasis kona TaxID=1008807 RepID=A0AAW2YMG8_9EUKA